MGVCIYMSCRMKLSGIEVLGQRVPARQTRPVTLTRPDRGVRDLDCNEVLEQLGDYLDDDAREELCKAIEAHLNRCRDCRLEVDTVKKTIVLYQVDREVPLPSTVFAHLESALAKEYGKSD